MKKITGILILLLLVVSLLACGSQDHGLDEDPVITAGVYSNEHFGLELPLPDGWHILDSGTKEFLQDTGEELFVEDSGLKAAMKASRKTTFNLLSVFEHEVGAAVRFNPNLILMAERVSHAPGIKSGKEYLFHTDRGLMMTELPYKSKGDAYPVQLGGREWYRADYWIDAPEMPVNQSYLAIKIEDYMLVMILSSGTEAQSDTLEEIASGLTFG